jgi:hypothetical protein
MNAEFVEKETEEDRGQQAEGRPLEVSVKSKDTGPLRKV